MGLGLDRWNGWRGRASDLRMGAVVALRDDGSAALVLAAETATADRLADLRALGPVDLALTGWRAETLKARAYDGDLARVVAAGDADLDWVRATADPSADLAWPMKGPYLTRRGGAAGAAPGGDRALQAGAPAAGGAGGAAAVGRGRGDRRAEAG